jgi:hypothetical protein
MAPLPWVRIWNSSCFHAGPDTRRLMAITPSKAPEVSSGKSPTGPRDNGIVERRIQLTEDGNRALEHGRGLRLVRHVAGPADRPVTGRGKPLGRDAQRALVNIDENDGGASLGECLRGREPDAGARAGGKVDFILKS